MANTDWITDDGEVKVKPSYKTYENPIVKIECKPFKSVFSGNGWIIEATYKDGFFSPYGNFCKTERGAKMMLTKYAKKLNLTVKKNTAS